MYQANRLRRTVKKVAVWQVALSVICCSILLADELAIIGEGQSLYSPFWYFDANTDAHLEITNNNTTAVEVNITLALHGKNPLQLPSLTVNGLSTSRLSVRDLVQEHLQIPPGQGSSFGQGHWGDGSRRTSFWGSAILEGEVTAGVVSWITSVNVEESLSVESIFRPRAYGSAAVASLWWQPSSNARTLFVLQNAVEEATSVRPIFYLNGKMIEGRSLAIAAKETILLDLHRLLARNGISMPQDNRSGSVLFIAADAPKTLIGRTLLLDEQAGFSASLEMKNVDKMLGNHLQAPGAPFGGIASEMGYRHGTSFDTKAILANMSDSEIDIDMTFYMKTDNESTEQLTATISVGAFESQVVSLRDLAESNDWIIPGGFVSVRIEHNGQPTDVVAEAFSVDGSLSASFHCPFTDVMLSASQKFAVSFDLSGDRNTLLIVKNTSDTDVLYSVMINFEEHPGAYQSYTTDILNIEPQGLEVIDIKKLRDQRIPDVHGNILPTWITFGNASVSADRPVIIGADPTYDPVTGITTLCDYSCDLDTGFWYDDGTDLFTTEICGILPPNFVNMGITGPITYTLTLTNFNPVTNSWSCTFRPCFSTNPCARTVIDILSPGQQCPPGIEQSFLRIRHWFFLDACLKLTHNHLPIRPCLP